MPIPLRGLRRTLPLEAGNIPATGTGQGPKVSSRMAERRVSSGPTARGDAMTPTRRARGLFHEITEGVYWFLALDVLLLLAAAPTPPLWSVTGAGPLSALLLVRAATPLLPALAAGPCTCRACRPDHGVIPARRFVRGSRLNARDSRRVGAPLLLAPGVLGVNITQGGAVGTSALALLFLALGGLVLLALVRAVAIVSAFSFRMIDVLRLAAFTPLARPPATLAPPPPAVPGPG